MFYLKNPHIRILQVLDREQGWTSFPEESLPQLLYLEQINYILQTPHTGHWHLTEKGLQYLGQVNKALTVDRMSVDRLDDYLIAFSVQPNSPFRRVPVLRCESLTDAFFTIQTIREDRTLSFNYNLFSESQNQLYHTCEVGFWDNSEEPDRVWTASKRSPSWAIFTALVKCFLEVRFDV